MPFKLNEYQIRETKMQLKIFDKIYDKSLYWYRKSHDTEGRYEYSLYKGEACMNFSLLSDKKRQIKEVWLPQYIPHNLLGICQDNTDEEILEQLTNAFLLLDRMSPAFPTEQKELIDAGDYVTGTCKGFNGKEFIQIHGLRKVNGKDRSSENFGKKNLREWKVFVSWNHMTGQATGYSVGLRKNMSEDEYKREVISITDPEDVAFWVLTVLRDQGTI